MHEVLVNRLGGLSLPRKSVVRLTDRPDMTLDVYRGRKTTMQQQQQQNPGKFGGIPSADSRDIMGTRISHADVDADKDADSNWINTETNMSLPPPPHSPLVGGHNYSLLKRLASLGKLILLSADESLKSYVTVHALKYFVRM